MEIGDPAATSAAISDWGESGSDRRDSEREETMGEKGYKNYRRVGERETVSGSLRVVLTAVRAHRDQADMRGEKMGEEGK